MADITWIVMSQPIKALVNTNNLEVYVAVDESIQEFFQESDCLRRADIEYYSINKVKNVALQHCDECDEKDCKDKFDQLVIILNEIEKKVLKAVSM